LSEIAEKCAMHLSIVASTPRSCVSVAQQRQALHALAATLIMIACSCSPQSEVAPSPVSGNAPADSAPQTGIFEGTVAQPDTGQRLEGVLVDAISGVGAGRATFTSGAGVFWLELPPGTTRLRWSKEGYVAREEQYTLVAGTRSEVQVWLQKVSSPAPFPPPPYTFTGTVRDSRRNPVGGAEIWLYSNDSPIDDRRGTGFADGSGRYTIVLQRTAQSVRALKDGYVPNDVSIFATSSSSTTFATDVTLRKIDRYMLLSPTSIRVGDTARVQGRAELDDGSSVTGCVCFQLVSSDQSAVAIDGSGSTGVIRGVAPGTATITGTYYGVTATLVVRVNAD
jgi:hypothetical protein